MAGSLTREKLIPESLQHRNSSYLACIIKINFACKLSHWRRIILAFFYKINSNWDLSPTFPTWKLRGVIAFSNFTSLSTLHLSEEDATISQKYVKIKHDHYAREEDCK